MKSMKIIAGTAIVALMYATTTFAAGDGTLSTTSSTASSDITLDIDEMVNIANVPDVSGHVDADSTYPFNIAAAAGLCVYTNNEAGTYLIKADGAYNTTGTGYKVYQSGGTHTIDYKAYWVEQGVGTSGGNELAHGVTETVSAGGHVTVGTDCNGGDDNNSNFYLEITQADMQAVPFDRYEGTLTLTVYPEP